MPLLPCRFCHSGRTSFVHLLKTKRFLLNDKSDRAGQIPISKKKVGCNVVLVATDSFFILNIPNAVLLTPNAVLLTPNAVLNTPNAVLNTPNAVLNTPNAILNTPNAILNSPNTVLNNVIR